MVLQARHPPTTSTVRLAGRGILATNFQIFVFGVMPTLLAETPPLQAEASHSASVGWTAGAGIEVAFGENWTEKIEYLYLSLA
jgi:opacity protein-like surface antigen